MKRFFTRQNISLKSLMLSLAAVAVTFVASAEDITVNYDVSSMRAYLGTTGYAVDGNKAYVVEQLRTLFENFYIEFSSSRTGQNYSCLYVEADPKYIRLRPIANALIPNEVTIKFRCPETLRVKQVSFKDKEAQGFGVKEVSCSTGSLAIPSKEEFVWSSDKETGDESFEIVVGSGGNNSPSVFNLYSISITYSDEVPTPDPVNLSDYLTGSHPDEGETLESVSNIWFNFSAYVKFTNEEDMKFEIVKDGEPYRTITNIITYGEDEDSVGRPSEVVAKSRDLFTYPSTLDISLGYGKDLTEPGNYSLTIPDNVLFIGITPTKGLTLNWTIAKDTTGVEEIESVNEARFTVYSPTGICLVKDGKEESLRMLPHGLYIVNGRKVVK